MYTKMFYGYVSIALATFLSISYGYVTPPERQFPAIKHLEKRDDIVALWTSIRSGSDNFVATGDTKQWTLNPAQAETFTTPEFYGCTVVIAVDVHSVVIGHYAEDGPNGKTMTDPNQVQKNVYEPLTGNACLEDFSNDARAWIIHTQQSSNTVGYRRIVDALRELEVPQANIRNWPYFGGSGAGEFPDMPKGKAVVTWRPRTDGSGGATLKIYIENDNPVFTQDYDRNGAPVPAGNQPAPGNQPAGNQPAPAGNQPAPPGKHKRYYPERSLKNVGLVKRNGSACAPKSIGTAPTPTPTTPGSAAAQSKSIPPCTYIGPEPPITPEAYCTCGSSSLPLTTIPGTPVPEESSCAYNSLPASTTSLTQMATPSTDLGLCLACTPRADNEDACTSITACQPTTTRSLILPNPPSASVTAGSSPVHVGTLTSTALYSSVSSALEKLCPPVTQTQSPTICETGSVQIGGIPFSDKGTYDYGNLIVTVEYSLYNVTSLRDAMIRGAALAIQNSATGKNCYTAGYSMAQPPKRDLDSHAMSLVQKRGHSDEHDTWCNGAGFAAANYYGPFAERNATDVIITHLEFGIQGGSYACDFLPELTDALAVVEPEFAVEDVELGEAIEAVCQEETSH